MKLRTICELTDRVDLAALARRAAEAFRRGDFHDCHNLCLNYWEHRRRGVDAPSFTDNMVTQLDHNARDQIGNSKHPPTDYVRPADNGGDKVQPVQAVSTPKSQDYMAYRNRDVISPGSESYINPDHYYERRSLTIVYSENGNLISEPYPTTHTELLGYEDYHDQIFSGTSKEGLIGQRLRGRYKWYVNGERVALLGRVSDDKATVSFWNTDQQQVERLLGPCIKELLRQRLITPQTIVMAPPLERSLPAGEVDKASVREISPEEQEQFDAMRQLHVARGDQKDALRRKAGMTRHRSRPHPVAQAMQRAGKLAPGQKWWGAESLKRRLDAVLCGGR